ncbi:hypothetical protein BB561_002904 [Smittium simulii]|uniref:triacylglycerol lipase n=1 Tax=Smittium simulii TaxID=133385 RepID=A0A2T9YNP5_9FUNG|nr:hypothetical protein BB561_002904 [Smittium simulii]
MIKDKPSNTANNPLNQCKNESRKALSARNTSIFLYFKVFVVVICLTLTVLQYSTINLARIINKKLFVQPELNTTDNDQFELQLSDVYLQHLPSQKSNLTYFADNSDYSSDKLPFLLKRWSANTPAATSSSNSNKNYQNIRPRLYPLELVKRTSKYAYSTADTHTNTYKKLYTTTNNVPQNKISALWGQSKSKTASMLEFYRKNFLSSQVGARTSYWDTKSLNASMAVLRTPIIDTDYNFPKSAIRSTGWKYRIEDGLLFPNVSHKPTLLGIARMAANAYIPKKSDDWETIGDPWLNDGFGWDDNGLRGHVFTTRDKNIAVISFKGTSASIFSRGDKSTSRNDRFNDNRLFSCCCAKVDFSWTPVCDCNVSKHKCSMTCLQKSLIGEDLYLYAAVKIFIETTIKYPDAYILLTGHSLGGSIASLLGLTFGIPAVAFEAPGELLAAKRLLLPMPPRFTMERLPTWHIGHNTDPIYIGSCNGQSSGCYYAGYAMESKCHLGKQCVYDTAKYLNWNVDIRHHRIVDLIYYVLEPWGKPNSKTKMPICQLEKNCKDCSDWNFTD